ncbi:MAG: class I SAM-dependent methyltransferase [Pseudomonadota bacterium]
MTYEAKFWDRMAPGYFKRPIGDEDAYQRKLAMTREHLTCDTRLLELGCGTGGTAIAHAPFVKSVHATDVSPKMLEIARQQAHDAGVSITFEQMDTAGFEAPSGSYDAILALSHLHLLEDWRSAISKAHGLLSPGGVFVTSTGCMGDTMAWFRFVAPIGKALRLLPLIQIFTSDTLRQAMTDAGFKIVEDWQPEKSQAIFIIAQR